MEKEEGKWEPNGFVVPKEQLRNGVIFKKIYGTKQPERPRETLRVNLNRKFDYFS